jgi:N-acetylglutamate synthase-like GNAT family acetyltransferase
VSLFISKENKRIYIKLVEEDDRKWVSQLIKEGWSSSRIVTRGRSYDIENLPGFIAVYENKKVGLLTYNIKNQECEIITLNSLIENIGIGTYLLRSLESFMQSKKVKRIWVITTNDNLDALRFYQKKGFRIKAIYIDAIKDSRKLKPEIPILGFYDIEIRDEIELEKKLKNKL